MNSEEFILSQTSSISERNFCVKRRNKEKKLKKINAIQVVYWAACFGRISSNRHRREQKRLLGDEKS
jgi:hypothetical protein